ncbi:MAG: hypothetical protein C0483_04995 [Pirellula sp.]|nr:hypothetical protein [Pirellula sp.]
MRMLIYVNIDPLNPLPATGRPWFAEAAFHLRRRRYAREVRLEYRLRFHQELPANTSFLSESVSMLSNQHSDDTELDLTPVRILALYPPVNIDVDLYLPESKGRATCLYASAGNSPKATDLDKLCARGIFSLLVPRAQARTLRAQLRSLSASSEQLAPSVRLECAREAVKEDFARAWCEKLPIALVKHAADFSQQVVDVCRSRDEMVSALASLAAHDRDTFAHISNVCVYSIFLARSAGINDDEQLLRIGQAGLLHDIGKRLIRTDILQKPGPLTDDERREINQHPRLGFEELAGLPNLTRDQLLTVYQHHERLDGSGYPVGLVGDEICEMAQLCAVVDVFDAFTARRSYRQAVCIEDALATIRRGAGIHFSAEYVECWTELVARTTPLPV